jgi:hypothetical protein
LSGTAAPYAVAARMAVAMTAVNFMVDGNEWSEQVD